MMTASLDLADLSNCRIVSVSVRLDGTDIGARWRHDLQLTTHSSGSGPRACDSLTG